MTQEYYSIITNTGLTKHATASLGGPAIDLTHLAVGDSNGTPYNPVATATALQNERHRTTITYVVVDEDNPNQIIAEAIIDETVGPFYLREVGIFDSDGDLFAIGKFPETFKPNLPSGSGKRLYVRMILGFASTPQVSLTVSSQAINNDPNFSTNVFNALDEKLAKAENLADLEDVEEAHENLGLGSAAIKDVGTTDGKVPLIGAGDKLDNALLKDAAEASKGIVQLASQAEVNTGTNDTKVITPLKLNAWFSAINPPFESAEQTITIGGSLAIAHGLGAIPKKYQAFLKCKNAESGYAVNDETPAQSWDTNDNGPGYGLTVSPDATNLNVRFGSYRIMVMNKSSGGAAVINPANWRLILRASKYF